MSERKNKKKATLKEKTKIIVDMIKQCKEIKNLHNLEKYIATYLLMVKEKIEYEQYKKDWKSILTYMDKGDKDGQNTNIRKRKARKNSNSSKYI